MERKRTDDIKEKLDQSRRVRSSVPMNENGFSSTMLEQVTRLCKIGLSNNELAQYLGIEVATLRNWINDYPEFKEAVDRGRIEADANVADKLYQLAIGYEMEVEELKFNKAEDRWELFRYTRRYAPNVKAIIKWLNSRRPEHWSETHKVDHSHTVTHKTVEEINMEGFTPKEKDFMLKVMRNQLDDGIKDRR
jgi:hypothetical protein